MLESFVWPENPCPVVLVGPTAVGKTAAAIVLAKRLCGEIVNADSMQVYRGMDIGTAKPTPEERREVPFHLLDIARPDQQLTVSDWKSQAEEAIADIVCRGRRPVISGGTGLYVRALLDDWTLAETPSDRAIRAELQREAEETGSAALHTQLQAVDPPTAARLHPNDTVRLVRALEVYRTTGRRISELQAENQATRRPRPALRFGLTMPRSNLYSRIEARVDAMMAAGLESEVRSLLAEGYSPSLGSMKSLGYKEIVSYLHGEMNRETAVETIKQNTRRYAKRQQTWFRADTLIRWLDVSALSSAEAAEKLIQEAE